VDRGAKERPMTDTLWSFAIASNEDIQARVFANVEGRGCAGHGVLHHLLHIGIHDCVLQM